MQITITTIDDSDDDCRRTTYETRVDGKLYTLAACSLRGEGVEERARELFGDDVEIVWEF
jgi:hypothetical protein